MEIEKRGLQFGFLLLGYGDGRCIRGLLQSGLGVFQFALRNFRRIEPALLLD